MILSMEANYGGNICGWWNECYIIYEPINMVSWWYFYKLWCVNMVMQDKRVQLIQAVHKPNEHDLVSLSSPNHISNFRQLKVVCINFDVDFNWYQIGICKQSYNIYYILAVYIYFRAIMLCCDYVNMLSAQFTLYGNNSLTIIIDHSLDGAKEGTHCNKWFIWLWFYRWFDFVSTESLGKLLGARYTISSFNSSQIWTIYLQAWCQYSMLNDIIEME